MSETTETVELSEEELSESLSKLATGNQQKIKWLIEERAPINQGQVALIRLNLLIDSLGLEHKDRLKFEIQFESLMEEMLDYMASALTKAKFTSTEGVDLSKLHLK